MDSQEISTASALEKCRFLFAEIDEQFQEPEWFHNHLYFSKVVLEAIEYICESSQIIGEHAEYMAKEFDAERKAKAEEYYREALEVYGLLENLFEKLSARRSAFQEVGSVMRDLRDDLNGLAESVSEAEKRLTKVMRKELQLKLKKKARG